jgi:hypothetical protein
LNIESLATRALVLGHSETVTNRPEGGGSGIFCWSPCIIVSAEGDKNLNIKRSSSTTRSAAASRYNFKWNLRLGGRPAGMIAGNLIIIRLGSTVGFHRETATVLSKSRSLVSFLLVSILFLQVASDRSVDKRLTLTVDMQATNIRVLWSAGSQETPPIPIYVGLLSRRWRGIPITVSPTVSAK